MNEAKQMKKLLSLRKKTSNMQPSKLQDFADKTIEQIQINRATIEDKQSLLDQIKNSTKNVKLTAQQFAVGIANTALSCLTLGPIGLIPATVGVYAGTVNNPISDFVNRVKAKVLDVQINHLENDADAKDSWLKENQELLDNSIYDYTPCEMAE